MGNFFSILRLTLKNTVYEKKKKKKRKKKKKLAIDKCCYVFTIHKEKLPKIIK